MIRGNCEWGFVSLEHKMIIKDTSVYLNWVSQADFRIILHVSVCFCKFDGIYSSGETLLVLSEIFKAVFSFLYHLLAVYIL